MKLVKVLCCMLLFCFLALTLQKHNSCLVQTEELTNRKCQLKTLLYASKLAVIASFESELFLNLK